MQFFHHFPLFIILLPMATAVAMPLIRDAKATRNLCLAVQVVLTLLSLGLLVSLWGSPSSSFVYMMGHFPAPWGNELRAGTLEAMLSLAFAAVMVFSLLGGADDLDRDIQTGKRHLYYVMINLIASSLMALVYTNDIFTAYVFIEINTIAACAIVVAKESGQTVKATLQYLIMSIMGSGLFLLATTILYALTGHLLMESAHESIVALAASGQYHLPLVVTLGLYAVSIAVKSALFPFHAWLPDAHGAATTTSSAVLSGLVLKGYIVLLIKLIYRVYGIAVIEQLGFLTIFFVLGLIGTIMGSVLAFKQTDIKRMIAYSTVSQIGYIFMGIGLHATAGFTAACYQIIAHAFTKSMLFIAAGSLIHTAGSKTLSEMTGAARKNKIAGAAFAMGALSMIGVPLFAGFASKFYLAEAAMQSGSGTWTAMLVLALSTFLNMLYYMPALVRLYARPDGSSNVDASAVPCSKSRPKSVVAPALACLMAANMALGILFVPLMNVIELGFSRLG